MNDFRSTLALAALIIGSSGTLAAEGGADQNWLTDQSGCKAVAPQKTTGMAIKATWDGACVDGLISGKGALKVGPVTYTGDFKQGQIASGELTMPGGGSYVGEFVDNSPAGRGVFKFPNMSLTATFGRNGETVGPVVMEWADGSRYEGPLNKDKRMEGKGRLTWANGNTHEGEFVNDLPHGTGTFTASSGWSYTGQWAHGQYEGRGTEVYLNGARYEGEFKAGKRHGQGRQTAPDGGVLEGEWKLGELDGQCKMEEASGSKYEGTCLAGRRSGRGRYENVADESVYEGEFKDNVFHGQGRVTAPGYVFEGAFALGKKNGRGKEVFEIGEQYEGDFVNSERTGQGVLRIADEEGTALTYDGTFKGGLFAGQGTLTVGKLSFQGEFKEGVFVRGMMHTAQGKTIEVDGEKQTFLEVLKDGTKVPVDPSVIELPPEA